MGVFGKLMDSMRIDPNPDDDEYGDDDYGYEEEPRKSFFKRNKQDDYDDYEEDNKPSLFGRNKQSQSAPVRRGMEISMIRPSAIEDARTICSYLLDGKTVVINLQGIHTELAQRILDFTSGAVYSIDGKLQKISDYVFVATPSNVDLTGEFQDMLNSGSIDLSGSSFKF